MLRFVLFIVKKEDIKKLKLFLFSQEVFLEIDYIRPVVYIFCIP